MTKRLKLFVALIAVLALVAAACSDDDGADTTVAAGGGDTTPATEASGLPDLGGRTVTVGVENAYLPFNYIPLGETEGTGWDYDMWDAICELLNCVNDMVESGWPAVIDQVANDELDTAADGISITDERKEIVDYSDAYMVVTQKLLVQLDDDRYDSAQAVFDDQDAKIGTQIGTTNYELILTYVNESRVDAFDQFPLAIQALISGDVDAVIIDDAAGLGYVGENAEQLKTIDDPLQSDPLGFIFPKGSDLIDPVNQAIQVLKDNGTFEELGRKYFTDAFEVTYDDIAPVG
ncbi:MAG: transporter substrate-binding domain-containing protein [Acidimicrobiia bacterium]|nr:transporter substrate-binding domain-containing protein [Acidimicrobiia bacterium]